MPQGKKQLKYHLWLTVPFIQFEAELHQQMIEEYQKYSKLNGFKPTVSKKDKEFSPK